jgi:hypothetical protein
MADKDLEIQEKESVVEETVAEETTTDVVEETVEEITETDSVTTEEVLAEDDLEEAKAKSESDDDEDDDDADDEEDDEDEDEKPFPPKKEGWKKGKKVAKEDIDVKEHIDAMLSGQDLTEDFKDKAQTIFEAAVLDKINEEVDRMEVQYAETLEENLVEIRTEISEKVDEYLTYVAKEWLEENKLAVENGLRLEIMEGFIKGLKTVFTENYIDIPEEKVDLYAESVKNLDETQSKLNEEIEKNVRLSRRLEESAKEIALNSVTEELTLTQKEKVRSLSEGVEFVSTEDYTDKLNIIRENYFPQDGAEVASEILDESETETAVEDSPVVIQEEASKQTVTSAMDFYANTLSRFAKK